MFFFQKNISSVPFYIEKGDSICVVPIYVVVFIYDANRRCNDCSLFFFLTTSALDEVIIILGPDETCPFESVDTRVH